MNSNALIAVEMVFVLGGALGWGLWELFSLRRDKKRQEEAAKKPPADAPHDPPH